MRRRPRSSRAPAWLLSIAGLLLRDDKNDWALAMRSEAEWAKEEGVSGWSVGCFAAAVQIAFERRRSDAAFAFALGAAVTLADAVSQPLVVALLLGAFFALGFARPGRAVCASLVTTALLLLAHLAVSASGTPLSHYACAMQPRDWLILASAGPVSLLAADLGARLAALAPGQAGDA